MMIKSYLFLMFIVFIISFNYAFGEENLVKNIFEGSEVITTITDYHEVIIGAIITSVGTHFATKFLEKRKHEHWLLKQFSILATEYYAPIAKFAWDASMHIEYSHSSKNEQGIRNAYYHICLFLSKYVSFKNNKGANFLFTNRGYENEAITAIRGILASLPFDDQDIIIIYKQMTESKTIFQNLNYAGETFERFRLWILSNECNKSKKLVIEKLDYLQGILDQGSERNSHPKVRDKFNSSLISKLKYKFIIMLKSKSKDDDPFYILFSSMKTAKQDECIQIVGDGFEHNQVEYKFYIGDKEVVDKQNSLKEGIIKLAIPKDDAGTEHLNYQRKRFQVIEFSIPKNIENGIYDIFAKFTVKRKGKQENKETIGIPIRILDDSSLIQE